MQQKIANEFTAVSGIGFPNCAGCADGLLIWIEKPSEEEAKSAGKGQNNCGRTYKFGMNCQAFWM